MRKTLALAMVMLLSLTIALAAVGCGKKQEAQTPAESTTPPAEAPADTSGSMAMPESAMADTSHH